MQMGWRCIALMVSKCMRTCAIKASRPRISSIGRAAAAGLVLFQGIVARPTAAVRVAPARISFCLRPPAIGQVRWIAGAAPPLLHIAMRGLPASTAIGIFLDEGTARSAYEIAHFRSSPVGAAVVSVHALIALPTRVRRLLFESWNGASLVVNAVAYPCRSRPPLPPTTDTLLRTIAVSVGPTAVAVDVQRGRAFIVNDHAAGRSYGGSVSVLDTRTGQVLGDTHVGRSPDMVVIAEHSGRAFITNRGSNTVSVLDARTGAVRQSITVGQQPSAIAVDEANGRVFVAVNGSRSGVPAQSAVNVLDARTGRVLSNTPVGSDPGPIAVSATTGRVFVVNNNGVSVLDASSGRLLHTVTVGRFPQAVAIDATTRRIFVANVGAYNYSSTPVGHGTVSMLDARSGVVLHTATVGTDPGAIAIDTATGRVFVVNALSDSVSVLDAQSGMILNTIPVGVLPVAIAADERTRRVFVVNRTDNSVSVLDARSGTILRVVRVGTSLAAAPSAVAVDPRRGRAFIVNTNDNSVSVLDATR